MTNLNHPDFNSPKKSLILLFSFSLIFLLAANSIAQNLSNELLNYNRDRIDLNKSAMLVLSGWAIGNIAVGSYGFLSGSGRTKYFHQMNAAWNVVNISIGAFAYYQYLHSNPSDFNLIQSINEARSIENILLLNIGLNVGYIATGAFLWERGIRKDHSRLLGYGPSLIMQGGFLLVFDSVIYALNKSQNEKMFNLLEKVTLSYNSLSVSIPL